jgi:oligoribonuclease NrnB/cAMP/cGMP phosphodiesterase (DHH superfamily)
MKPICIYHGNCADGMSAAAVVAWKLGADNVDFHPGFYGEDPPDVKGRTVYVVDFSYPREQTVEMAKQAEKIIILDHHKTAEKNLVDLPDNVEAEFDMNRSGAMMAWDYFYPGEKPPRVLEHVQDRDLWRFKLENTREIQAALFSYPYDIELWCGLVLTDEHIDQLIQDGVAINRKHLKDVHELIDVGTHEIELAGYTVPALNVPYMHSSEAGSKLAIDKPFAACYFVNENEVYVSLRSTDEGVDVSEVAESYGGGGHKKAAAFRMSRTDFKKIFPK